MTCFFFLFRRRCKKPKLLNGNHVIVTLSNGEADNIQEDMTAQAVFAPSPKPEKNGKVDKNSKLADVPEEDSHCEDADEPDTDVTDEATEAKEETENPTTDVTEEKIEASEPSTENTHQPENTDSESEHRVIDVSVEINNIDPEETGNEIDNPEQKSEL